MALFAMLCHEVLAEIFLCYAETAELLSPTPKLPPPLLLGQICSIWRYVVHDTPKLWTGFSLEFVGEEGYEGKVDHISFAKAWFERARPYPLRVSLRVSTFNKKFGHILDVILSSADRIQYLHYISHIHTIGLSSTLLLGPWHFWRV